MEPSKSDDIHERTLKIRETVESLPRKNGHVYIYMQDHTTVCCLLDEIDRLADPHKPTSNELQELTDTIRELLGFAQQLRNGISGASREEIDEVYNVLDKIDETTKQYLGHIPSETRNRGFE